MSDDNQDELELREELRGLRKEALRRKEMTIGQGLDQATPSIPAEISNDEQVRNLTRLAAAEDVRLSALRIVLEKRYATAPEVTGPASEDSNSARRLAVGTGDVRVVHAVAEDVDRDRLAEQDQIRASQELMTVVTERAHKLGITDQTQINAMASQLIIEARQKMEAGELPKETKETQEKGKSIDMKDQSKPLPATRLDASLQKMNTPEGQAAATLGAIHLSIIEQTLGSPFGPLPPGREVATVKEKEREAIDRMNKFDKKLFEIAVAAEAEIEGIQPDKAREALKKTWQPVAVKAEDKMLWDDWMKKYQNNMETTAESIGKLPKEKRAKVLMDMADEFVPEAHESRQRLEQERNKPKPPSGIPAKAPEKGAALSRSP